MLEIGLGIAYVLFLWWFSTGLIVYLDGLPRRTHLSTFIVTSLLACIALAGLVYYSNATSTLAALMSFSCGLMLWAWQELSYFTGFITGTRKHRCEEGCKGWKHFGHAIQANLYHEIAIISVAIIVLSLTWGQVNQIGTWTYMLLWLMQTSAKLNVFLGVRNVSEEFLPAHMSYMKSFLRKKNMNVLFPFSITLLTVLFVFFVQQGVNAEPSSFQSFHYFLLSAIVAMAVLEHWLLVLPISSTALWNWWLKLRDSKNTESGDFTNRLLSIGSAAFPQQALVAAGGEPVIKDKDSAIATQVTVGESRRDDV